MEEEAESITKNCSLEQQALAKIKSGQYKDAIGLYKQLIKDTDNEPLRMKVSEAIEKTKAFNLFDKYNELFFSDREKQKPLNNEKVETEPSFFKDQLIEIIQSDNDDQLPTLLSQLSTLYLDKQHSRLATVLGLLMLTKYSGDQHYLSQDSIFFQHLNIVQIALKAYQDNNQEKLSEALRSIPFRSAFKDFRVVVSAVLVEETSVEKRLSLLCSIPDKSPYFLLAQLLLVYNKDGAELVNDLFSFNYSQQILIEQIKDFNEHQLEFIAHLLRQYDDLSEKNKFSMAIQYKTLFGFELAEHYCQTRLVNYPAGHKDYIKYFGEINEFEELRIKALSCEQDDNLYDAEYYWRQCIDQLLKREEEGGGLKVALIYRRIADQQQEVAVLIDYLAKSLQYDPDDKDTYLKVLDDYANKEQEIYQRWLNQALDRFPQDVDFLILAMRVANNQNDTTQVNKYAQRLLQIEPQNSEAKQTLFVVHLSQVKKLITEKKYVLAEQQFVDIEELNLAVSYMAQSQLIRDYLIFIQSNLSTGQEDIIKTLKLLYSDPINMQFKASMEALVLGLLETDITIPIDQYSLSSEELSQLIEQIESYTNEGSYQKFLHKALDQIKPILLKSLQQIKDEKLWLNLSQQINLIHHYDLLNGFATLALEKWPQPIWVYYQVQSETKNQAEHCSYINLRRLQQYLELAREENDHRSIVLIDDFLKQYKLAHPGKMTRFFQNLFTDQHQQSSDDPMEQLFGDLSDEILIQLQEPVERLSKQTSLEQIAQLLNHDDNDILLAMMQEPDLFNALIVVKAAEQSGIEINIGIEKVLEYFDVVSNNTPNFL
ncbi:MAG: hypothetical protein KAH20_13650 [Methylococcales bacterium]|nr:hypothetical protein [Methylococcales bacterium]